ncbi:MAG TPA: SDR family NAD(P)-dependent oxidoreductase [Bacillota bacterium]|nr:SDR family NAD(P)-dependent oxidoreductase [Bacillota bacterium]
MKDLDDKVVVLTGAGSGIGRALAYRLSMEKAVLALADIDMEGLQITKQLIQADLGEDSARLYRVDVAQREQVTEFAQKVIRDFGRVDLVINNAGVSSSGRVHELTYDTLEWTIDINLWGVIHGTKAFLPHLMERPEAGIVNISSVYGLLGIPGQAAYCTSKFAVRGFTESLRQELSGTNIFVTLVFPGGVKTSIAKNSRTDYQIDEATYQKGLQQFETTLKTQPETAAEAIISGIKHKSPRVLIGRDARQIDRLARFCPNSYDKVIAKHFPQ